MVDHLVERDSAECPYFGRNPLRGFCTAGKIGKFTVVNFRNGNFPFGGKISYFDGPPVVTCAAFSMRACEPAATHT